MKKDVTALFVELRWCFVIDLCSDAKYCISTNKKRHKYGKCLCKKLRFVTKTDVYTQYRYHDKKSAKLHHQDLRRICLPESQ